jgi:hypothetical protein
MKILRELTFEVDELTLVTALPLLMCMGVKLVLASYGKSNIEDA